MAARKSRKRMTMGSLSLGAGCLAGVCVSVVACLIPIDVIQGWAINRASSDPYAQFEAAGRAEALWWFLRVSAVAGTLMIAIAWFRGFDPAGYASDLFHEFSALLKSGDGTEQSVKLIPRAGFVVRGLGILAMLVLAGMHQVEGIMQRASDWSYYRLRDGAEVLPNISDSNRAVIRYLRAATPENSRIFVVSDQKLYFLSYYLRPRRVLHRVHPDAEHLMPQANQGRQLAAYRQSEISPELLRAQKPDFVLEYFEGPEYVQPERAMEDGAWLSFIRGWQRDSQYIPPYTVVLRPWAESEP